MNSVEVDNIPKKHKKSKKTSQSLSDDTILSEHTESRKAVKRENSIPLDNIETETKKRKKHAKKSKEFDPSSENEEKVVNNTENTISRFIKSEEEQHTIKKHIISNTDISSSNVDDNVSKKRKKNKEASMKISDSESESHVKIKIEKQDPIIDRITNENQISYSEDQIVQNENLKMLKFVNVKKEVSIKYDSFEKERKKSSKKHRRDSQSVEIKNEDIINDVSDISDKEKKKSSKKHAHVSRDSEIRIKKENITNDINDISRAIKREPEDSQYISAIDSSLNNSDLEHVSKKSKKKKASTILSDSEYSIKIKTEKV